MSLLQTHKLLTYALVLIPFVVLQLGGEMSPLMTLTFLVGVVGSWFWELPRVDPDRFSRPLMLLAAALFAGTGLRLLTGDSVRIEPFVDLALLLTVLKLMQRRNAGDYAQLMALSFLLLTAASAFNQGLAFGLAFATYMIVGTIALSVKHLREEIAEHHPTELARYRPARGLLLTVGGLAVVVFAFSVLFFLAFPRMGFGLFNTMGRTGLMTSGFSDTVSLGQHGTIRDDQTVVMRVRFPDGGAGLGELRWRGTSFDDYDGTTWRRHDPLRASAYQSMEGHYSDPFGTDFRPDFALVQDIYLEPLDTPILFGLPTLRAVSFPDEDPDLTRSFFREFVRVSGRGEFFLERRSTTGVHYLAYSDTPSVTSWAERWPGDAVDFRQRDRRWDGPVEAQLESYYLSLPEGLTEDFGTLARDITTGARTPLEAAQELESYLRSTYTYTTDLPPVSPDNPLESFLFDTRRGHCEYFATAMALLAREVGLPSRNVNGFLGGDWNPIGSFYAVRQSHAHSWVEIYLPRAGWTTFDPTPAIGLPPLASGGLWESISAFFDSLRMLWYESVVDYSLEQQIGAVRSVLDMVGQGDDLVFDVRSVAFALFRNLAVVLFGVMLWGTQSWLLWRRHRRDLPWGWRDTLLGALPLLLSVSATLASWRPKATPLAVFLAALLPALTWATARAGRRGRVVRANERHGRRRLGAASRIYLDLVRRLMRQGFDVRATDTPARVVAKVRGRAAGWVDALTDTLALYERCRFGQGAGEHLDSLRRSARRLQRAMRAARPAPGVLESV